MANNLSNEARGIDYVMKKAICWKCRSRRGLVADCRYLADEDAYEFIFRCHGDLERIKIPKFYISEFINSFAGEFPFKVFMGANAEPVFKSEALPEISNLLRAEAFRIGKKVRIGKMEGSGILGDSLLRGNEEMLVFPTDPPIDPSMEAEPEPFEIKKWRNQSKLKRVKRKTKLQLFQEAAEKLALESGLTTEEMAKAMIAAEKMIRVKAALGDESKDDDSKDEKKKGKSKKRSLDL